jgi:DNA (cytosine-5)-methyltransferase 1
MLNGLSLFSGIGGIDVALSEYVRTVAYCEIDLYCQGVLLSRMASGDICNAPIWDDVATFEGKEWRGAVDIIVGGFP